MPVNNSPLRYPGGKSQLAPYVIELLRANDLFGGVYAEPFAGGAGIAWRLLFDSYASEVWINDIDPSIYSFWNAALNHPDDLCELIETSPITMDQWRKQKELQSSARNGSLALGFSTLFLNRTNRSGILKAGVIGGQAQAGEWKLDCRFNRANLIEKIQRIAIYKDQINLTCIDAYKYLTEQCKRLPKVSLLNIDPPYYKKGPGLYCSFYGHADHVALSKVIRRLKHPWMLTYDDAEEIRKLYDGLPMSQQLLTYYAQVKRTGIELMVTAPSLNIPDCLQDKAA